MATIIRIASSSYQFKNPRGYWACWYVQAEVDGRSFAHKHTFGKAGTRSPVPDEHHRAQKLADRVARENFPMAHFQLSPHWVEVTEKKTE
jgi:hypothetical protein